MTDTASDDSFFVRHRTLLLLTAGILLYLPLLGLRDLWYADEPDIAEVCRTMFVTGDWIAPRRLGVIWVDYPPMIYWTATAASHLLGRMSEFSLRLPNALASIGLALLTCSAASRWFNPRAGLWAGFMLLTCIQFVHQAISYRPDVLFSLTIAAGLLIYARGASDRPRLLLRILGFALLGAAMLSKGPLGLLLPGLVLTLWHGTRREWRRMFGLAPLALVSLAVYLPWFVACGKAMGADSIVYEFYAQNIQRFFAGDRGHARPVTYYLTRTWVDLAPWSPLVPFAIAWLYKSGRWRDRNVQLALWWFAAFLGFLSIAVTKRHIYLMPAYPAVALLMGPWLAGFWRTSASSAARPPAWPVRAYGVFVSAVAVGLGLGFVVAVGMTESIVTRADLSLAQAEVARALRAPLLLIGAILAAAAIWILAAWRRGDIRGILVRSGLVQFPLFVILGGWVMPAMNPIKTYVPEARWIAERIAPEKRFGMVAPRGRYYGKAGAFGYYSESLIDYLEGPDEVDGFLDEHPGSVVLVHEWRVEELFANDPVAWRSRVVREMPALDETFVVVEKRAGPLSPLSH
jgi:4-amino-4-deoxy-L-arabinose transferase-like glycosyltransferase